MSLLFTALRTASVVALCAVVTACVIDERDRRDYRGGGPDTQPATAPAPGTQPLLAAVDTGQTMNADPGEGIGVFIEYRAGGAWHLFWTCDTNQTGHACDFVVKAVSQAGSIDAVDIREMPTGSLVRPDAASVVAKTHTAAETHGITFSTAPGDVVTLTATAAGVTDGSFLFFVQDGKINGGYAGALTNPLSLQGTSP